MKSISRFLARAVSLYFWSCSWEDLGRVWEICEFDFKRFKEEKAWFDSCSFQAKSRHQRTTGPSLLSTPLISEMVLHIAQLTLNLLGSISVSHVLAIPTIQKVLKLTLVSPVPCLAHASPSPAGQPCPGREGMGTIHGLWTRWKKISRMSLNMS